jgi:hypothetical protein
MRSDCGSVRQDSKWRCKRTLRRKPSFRPIEDGDVQYAWAAYKKGALAPMGEAFTQEMSAEQFKELFEAFVLSSHHGAWTLLAPTARGTIPIGIVLAAWAPNAPFMIVNGCCWFPWASKRNIVEAAVAFFAGIRKEVPMVFYALPEHRRAYDVCAMHGVIRRVGTSLVASPGHLCAVFETRTAA